MPARGIARSAARLAAVQALYQQQMEGTPEAQLLDEFHRHRLGAEIEDVQFADADRVHFDDVVKGVLARIEEIDALLSERLADGWRLDRLDKTMVQVLRAGAYELLARADVATATIITEYVDVAHAFFEEREAKFVNGVLDAVGKGVR
ncbi:transcription antitermination factor NusB [Novosphingobium sp. FSY-8]|uniref:Transcription antitermination protein NusB n=2 Tax=Novosphingobium ovatum TaxID=1908523 RepID=A0ABW9XAV2_9SPHN|nr:transcription antitermination factor NusB [Novosphingobium ovatum]